MKLIRHLSALLLLTALSDLDAKPTIELIESPDKGLQPVAQIDGDRTLHIVYFKGEPANGDLFYASKPADKRSFSKPVRVNEQRGSAIAMGTIRGAQMALGGEGVIHVAWMGSGETRPKDDHHKAPLLYARSTDGGRTFEKERNVIREAYGLDGGGSIAADGKGNVWISWHAGEKGAGETERKVWVASSTDDGKTFERETPAWDEPTGACGCCGLTSFASRNTGTAFVLYRSATEKIHRDMYLLSSSAKDGRFKGTKVDEWELQACPMSSAAFAENASKVVAAWESRGGNLAFSVFKNDGSDVTSTKTMAKRTGKKRKYPTVAINESGQVLLAWVDGAGWKRGGMLRWQIFDSTGNAAGEKGEFDGVPAWSKPAALSLGGDKFAIVY